MNLFLLTLSLAVMSKFVAFSWVIGSVKTFFSAISVTGPLVVVFGGLPGGLLYLFLNLLCSVKKTLLFTQTGLPNLLAGCYWKGNSKFIKLALPIFAMAVFWYSTWGTSAAWYATLWLIPVLIELCGFNNLFSKALGATWIAHATGSILWLYFGKITADQWVLIMPIALIERFCLAILMVGMYKLIQAVCGYKIFGLLKNMQQGLKRVL